MKSHLTPESKEAKVTTSASASVEPLDTYEGPAITALDIIVGRITKVWEHPEADKLYCEEIDVGEDSPRQVASGLRPYMSAEDMEGRLVLVLCNLKARKMLGFPSHGMVLCASSPPPRRLIPSLMRNVKHLNGLQATSTLTLNLKMLWTVKALFSGFQRT